MKKIIYIILLICGISYGASTDRDVFTDGTNFYSSVTDLYQNVNGVLETASGAATKIENNNGSGTNVTIYGGLTYSGSAKPVRNITLVPGSINTPALRPATLESRGAGVAWEFSNNQDESIQISLIFPAKFDVTEPIDINIGWDTATTNATGVWEFAFAFLETNKPATTIDGTSILYAVSSDVSTAPTISGFQTITNYPTNAAAFVATITRLGGDASDTLNAAAFLHGVGMRYRVDTEGEE